MIDTTAIFATTLEIENLKIFIDFKNVFFNKLTSDTKLHSHTKFEFNIICDGEAILSTHNNNIMFKKNQACVIPPNIIRTWIPKNDSVTITNFCFSYEKIKKNTNKDVYTLFDHTCKQIKDIKRIDEAQKYIDELKRIMSVFLNKEGFAPIKFQLYFSEFMLELADDISESTSNNSYTFDNTYKLQEKELHQIIIDDFIESNYNKQVTIASLAEVLHLSTKQTERIFARESNTSFKEHLIKKRIEVAMNYLKNTNLSANEIAQRVGYDSYDGFYRTFTSRVGMSPQEYRKKTKK